MTRARRTGCCRSWLLTLALAWMPMACAETPPQLQEACPAADRAALDSPRAGAPIPLAWITPADGAVVPWGFPSLDLRWRDGFQADLFRIRISPERGPALVELTTAAREVRLGPERWDAVRSAVGAGGTVVLEVTAASMAPGGPTRRGPTTATARVRLSSPEDHPTGALVYLQWFRPPGSPPGPMPYNRVMAAIMREGLDGTIERLSDRWLRPHAYRVEPSIPGWDPPPLATRASRSYDFSAVEASTLRAAHQAFYPLPRVAAPSFDMTPVLSADGACEARPRVVADYGFRVVRTSDDAVLYESKTGWIPRFTRQTPNRLAWVQRANEIGNDTLQSFYQSDIWFLDVGDGRARLFPGASSAEHCEVFPEWTADGRALVFSRAPAGLPCDGRRGKLDLMRVSFAEGAPSEPTVLVASSTEWGANSMPRCSPDGRWIVFVRARRGFHFSGDTDLWIVSTAGGEPRKLAASSLSLETWPAFSPDGRWLAFLSNRDRVEHNRGYVARFLEDGEVAPAVPLPWAGGRDASLQSLDWRR